MGKRFMAIIICMILLFPVHLYVTGSVMALWKIVDETAWKAEKLGDEAPVKIRTKDWVEYWAKKPFSVIGFVAKPEDDFQIDVQKRTLWATPAVYLIVFYMSFLKIWRKRKYDDASKYGSHGTARWAKVKEIFRLGEVTRMPVNERNGPGVILGYLTGTLRKIYVTLPPDSEYNQNIIAFGGSGIGKSYTWVKTQILNTIQPFIPRDSLLVKMKLLLMKMFGPLGKYVFEMLDWQTQKRKDAAKSRNIPTEYSLVVVDPKGENYRDTSAILEKNGYKVWMINLIDLFLSAHWNPMDYVRDDLEAEDLSITIISNSSLGHRGGGDPFWERAENALLAALILFVKNELAEEQQNLTNVLQIILTIGEDEDMLNGLFDNLPFNHPAKMKFAIFRLAEDKTRTGILIGFSSHLQLWTNRHVQDLTVQSDFKLGDLGLEKTALFLVIPDAKKTFKSVTSLFFAQCFQEWWKVAKTYGDTLPIGIRLIMDEFANIGYIPDFPERMSVMRSKGVSAQIILQTRSQLDNLYKDTADIINAACDTTVFLGTKDDKTAEQMSKDLGDATIKVQSTSNDPNKISFRDKSISEQYQGRKLMDPAEIKRNSRKLNIIIQNGAFPFKTKKTPYTKHPLFKDYKSRPVEEYKAPPTRPYMLFDFEEYLAENGILLDLLEKDSEKTRAQGKQTQPPLLKEENDENVLSRIYQQEVAVAKEEVKAIKVVPTVQDIEATSNEMSEHHLQPTPQAGQNVLTEMVDDLTSIGNDEHDDAAAEQLNVEDPVISKDIHEAIQSSENIVDEAKQEAQKQDKEPDASTPNNQTKKKSILDIIG